MRELKTLNEEIKKIKHLLNYKKGDVLVEQSEQEESIDEFGDLIDRFISFVDKIKNLYSKNDIKTIYNSLKIDFQGHPYDPKNVNSSDTISLMEKLKSEVISECDKVKTELEKVKSLEGRESGIFEKGDSRAFLLLDNLVNKSLTWRVKIKAEQLRGSLRQAFLDARSESKTKDSEGNTVTTQPNLPQEEEMYHNILMQYENQLDDVNRKSLDPLSKELKTVITI